MKIIILFFCLNLSSIIGFSQYGIFNCDSSLLLQGKVNYVSSILDMEKGVVVPLNQIDFDSLQIIAFDSIRHITNTFLKDLGPNPCLSLYVSPDNDRITWVFRKITHSKKELKNKVDIIYVPKRYEVRINAKTGEVISSKKRKSWTMRIHVYF